MTKSRLQKVKDRKENFDPRGSLCPICNRGFRGCPHSIVKVEERLKEDYEDTRLDSKMKAWIEKHKDSLDYSNTLC